MLGIQLALLSLASRVELHVHLDGAVDSTILFQVAQLRNLSLPGVGVPHSEADVNKAVKSQSAFARFDVVNNIIGGNVDALKLVGRWFAARQASLNATYTEVRYDPRRAAASSYDNSSLTLAEAIGALSDGLAAGAAAAGIEVYSLLCAMRGEAAERCYEVAEAAASAQRPWKGTRPPPLGAVVGIDLAGDEWTYPNAAYTACFRHAKQSLGLNTTVHAGEASSPGDVLSAVVDMGVDRIGHGYIAAKNASLLALVAARGVHLEACPGTALAEGSLSAVGAFLKHNVSFGLNEARAPPLPPLAAAAAARAVAVTSDRARGAASAVLDDPSTYFGGCGFPCIEAIVNDCTGDFRGSLEARLLCDAEFWTWLHFTKDDVERAYAEARRAAFAN